MKWFLDKTTITFFKDFLCTLLKAICDGHTFNTDGRTDYRTEHYICHYFLAWSFSRKYFALIASGDFQSSIFMINYINKENHKDLC